LQFLNHTKMMNQKIDISVLDQILDVAMFSISDILPSEWAEKYRVMSSGVSSVEGSYSFDKTPYVRELVDFLHPSNPYKCLVVMKGAQLGLSTGFIENGIGWIISENPGPTLLLVGHDDLVEPAMKKIDDMLDSTGTRKLIKSNANRAKNNKSGDKDRSKEFSGGYLNLGSTNHKTLRQVSYRYGFIDDFESMRSASKESGGTVPLIMQRFSTYNTKMKLSFTSTPEVRETSNIEPEYLKGDQRKYFVPCPCCGEYITLEWDTENKANKAERAGITWQLDENSNIIEKSVGYICQECGDFFTDQHKDEMIRNGHYRPTAIPTDPTYTSYHISSLYAPSFMYGWIRYVRQYLEANPPGQPRNEVLHQTFVNLVLGQTYEPEGETINASQLQKNTRPYALLELFRKNNP
jgi:phage terminase large subunit GpA-like protein